LIKVSNHIFLDAEAVWIHKARRAFESFSTGNNSIFPMENILKALLICIQIDR